MKDGQDKALIPSSKNMIMTEDISPIVQLAMKGKFDIEHLDKMIDVQEKFEKIQAQKQFNIAFAKFKKTAPIISKDGSVDFTNKQGVRTQYKHPTLANLMSVVTPLLADQGLALFWEPNQKDGDIFVTAILVHELGRRATATLSAPPDGSGNKNPIQAVNSTVTYLERYTGFAILGLASAEDNDGQGAPDQNNCISPDQIKNLESLINRTENWENDALLQVVCAAYNVPDLGNIQSKDYDSVCSRISQS